MWSWHPPHCSRSPAQPVGSSSVPWRGPSAYVLLALLSVSVQCKVSPLFTLCTPPENAASEKSWPTVPLITLLLQMNRPRIVAVAFMLKLELTVFVIDCPAAAPGDHAGRFVFE